MSNKLKQALKNQKIREEDNQIVDLIAFGTAFLATKVPFETKQKIEENSFWFKLTFEIFQYLNSTSNEERRLWERYFQKVSNFNSIFA